MQQSAGKIAEINQSTLKRKRGQPTKYTTKLGKEICAQIALGKTVLEICREKGIHVSVVYLWLLDDDKRDFFDLYARSRIAQAGKMFDELLEIADYSAKDIVGGDDKADNARVQAHRLRVDTRKWYLSKVLPKVYGDKLDLTSGGEKLPVPILQLTNVHNTIKESTATVIEKNDLPALPQ